MPLLRCTPRDIELDLTCNIRGDGTDACCIVLKTLNRKSYIILSMYVCRAWCAPGDFMGIELMVVVCPIPGHTIEVPPVSDILSDY